MSASAFSLLQYVVCIVVWAESQDSHGDVVGRRISQTPCKGLRNPQQSWDHTVRPAGQVITCTVSFSVTVSHVSFLLQNNLMTLESI